MGQRMKNNRKLLSIVLLLSGLGMIILNGCTKNNPEIDTTFDQNMEGSNEDINPEGSILSEKTPKEMTTAEKLQYLSIEGQQIGLPCKVSDLTGGLALGNGVTIENEKNNVTVTICFLEHDGLNKGKAFVDDCDVGPELVDMSSGYEDKWIYNILSHEFKFEILGVTDKSSMDDIISEWGEPPYKKTDEEGGVIEYYDAGVNPEIDQEYDYISFGFDDDGSLLLCIFNTVSSREKK